jgi:hypothetical protein
LGFRTICLAIFLLLLTSCAEGAIPENVTPGTQPTGQASSTGQDAGVSRSETESPGATVTDLTQDQLDLREANVTNVVIEHLGEGRIRFDVTLLHDDDGEAPSYADRWEVVDADGDLLGERILTHSHGTQPFTRSAILHIEVDLSVVHVRGHDMLHGYGGQSMSVDLSTGETRAFQE